MRTRLAVIRAVVILAGVILAGVALTAADVTVTVSPHVDFSAFSSFAIHDTTVNSSRPEFDNALFVKKLSAIVRKALRSHGLREVSSQPDLVVDYVLTSEELDSGASRPRRPMRLTGTTLVVDIRAANESDPVWRGVYRDQDERALKLVQRAWTSASKMLSRFPRR
jgi:hypothetical protein